MFKLNYSGNNLNISWQWALYIQL